MSNIVYKYLETPKTPEIAVDTMQNIIAPLFEKYWQERGKQGFNRPLDFNVLTFVQMWLMGSLLMIVAYEDNKPVGFFVGVRFTPLMFKATAVQAEVYYGPTKEIEDGLFKYLMNIVGFMDIDEVWINYGAQGNATVPWPKKNSFTVERFVKE